MVRSIYVLYGLIAGTASGIVIGVFMFLTQEKTREVRIDNALIITALNFYFLTHPESLIWYTLRIKR